MALMLGCQRSARPIAASSTSAADTWPPAINAASPVASCVSYSMKPAMTSPLRFSGARPYYNIASARAASASERLQPSFPVGEVAAISRKPSLPSQPDNWLPWSYGGLQGRIGPIAWTGADDRVGWTPVLRWSAGDGEVAPRADVRGVAMEPRGSRPTRSPRSIVSIRRVGREVVAWRNRRHHWGGGDLSTIAPLIPEWREFDGR
jgi:hypothetical protein